MTIILRYLILFISFIALAACHKPADATDSHGNAIHLPDYKDKWLVINYWASWCKPCLTELPELNALHAGHNDKLVVFGVNFDGLSSIDIQRFAEPMHLTLPLFSHFPIEKFGVKEIPSLPVTFIVDPQGKLSKTLYGPQTQESLLDATLKKDEK